MRISSLLTCGLGLLAAALPSSAQLDVRINLGTNGPDGNWTNITNGVNSFTVIDFETGEDTGATASTLFSALNGGNGSGAIVEDWVVDIALANNGGSNFSGGAINIANFPQGTYKVEVLASREFDVYGGEFTVNGEAPDTTYRGLPPQTSGKKIPTDAIHSIGRFGLPPRWGQTANSTSSPGLRVATGG